MSDTVTDAGDLEALAIALGFLADDDNNSLNLTAAPVSQQDGGRGDPAP